MMTFSFKSYLTFVESLQLEYLFDFREENLVLQNVSQFSYANDYPAELLAVP